MASLPVSYTSFAVVVKLLSFVLLHYFLSFYILLFLFVKFVVGIEEECGVTVDEYGISFRDD